MAGNSWREHMAGKGCAEYVIVKKNGDRSGKKMVACTSRPTAGQLVLVGPLQADWTLSANCRPTRLDLVADSPIGQKQADGPPVGLLWAD